jgi:mannose-6-phosphate isomerase-like protein (cupin superfamily)
MKKSALLLTMFISLLSFAGGYFYNKLTKPPLESYIYKQAEVKKSGGDWGNIYMYTNDSTTTLGSSSMLTAMLEFMPGKQLQPPHQHSQEEFQYIIEGSGTWFLNGVETPIKKGDLMYAKPWDLHGIRNSGKDTLKFFVVKWQSKGVPVPVGK